MKTTRWKLDNPMKLSLDDYSDQIIKKNILDTDSLENIKIKSNEDEKKIYNFDNNVIEYRTFLVSYEIKKTTNVVSDESRLVLYKDKHSEEIYGIFDKNSGAKHLLRQIINPNKNNSVVSIGTDIGSNIIIWIIKTIYENGDSNSDNISLNYVTGFKGSTTDNVNTVNIRGDGTLNLLSSLSFLLESNKLNNVTVDLSYGDDNPIIQLDLSTNTVSLKHYKGIYSKEEYTNYNDAHLFAVKMLFVYIVVIPDLVQSFENYKVDLDVDGRTIYLSFIDKIKKDINLRISQKKDEFK